LVSNCTAEAISAGSARLKAGLIAAASIRAVASVQEKRDEQDPERAEERCRHQRRPHAVPAGPVLREAVEGLVVLDQEGAQTGDAGGPSTRTIGPSTLVGSRQSR
jgi:hypothetical protein